MRLSAQSAHASYTRAQCFPLNTHPSRDKRSLTARGPVRGSPRRARSFGYCLSSRARSAVSRDGSRRSIRYEQVFLDLLCGYAPSPLATCAAQIHTTLCGQFLLSMFALSCDRARGALPKARFWRGALSSRATVIVALSALRSKLGLWLCYADTLPSRNLRGTNPHHSLRSIFFRRYLSPFSFPKENVVKERGHLAAALSSYN